jgi:hypothetical protein
MRKTLVIVAALYSAAAFAQSNPPANAPTVGDKPLVQVKPKGAAKQKAAAEKPAEPAKPAKPKSIAGRLQACLEIDDATKERLNCYDAVIPPKPKAAAKGAKGAKADARAAPPKAVTECGTIKEEDERLTCFNGFVERLPKLPS